MRPEEEEGEGGGERISSLFFDEKCLFVTKDSFLRRKNKSLRNKVTNICCLFLTQVTLVIISVSLGARVI